METGIDILRPWVSRMILLSLFMTGRMPFRDVYLHGMIVDDAGVKMSKSKDNVVGPMEVINEYGADALRISLCGQTSAAQPQKFTRAKIIAGRNFCNKLWNIGRFVQNASGGEDDRLEQPGDPELCSAADHWIWAGFLKTKSDLDEHLKNYRFAKAWETVADFIWGDLADWYLESCKWQINKPFLGGLFIRSLHLVHPFAPFTTEALYQEMASDEQSPLLMANSLLETDPWSSLVADKKQIELFEETKELIARIRRLLPLDLRRQSRLVFKEDSRPAKEKLDGLCRQLTAVKTVQVTDEEPEGLLVNHRKGYEAWIVLEREILQLHVAKIEKELAGRQAAAANLRKRLGSRVYLEKAPPELVEDSRQQLRDLEERTAALTSELDEFGKAL